MVKIGLSIGTTTPNKIMFISNKPVRLGQFVVIDYYEEDKHFYLLGMVQNVFKENQFLTEDISSVEKVEGTIKFSQEETQLKAEVSILGKVIDTEEEVFLQVPRTPPSPGTNVYEAPSQLLKKIFGAKKDTFVRIGILLSEKEEVPVYIDIEQVVLRHLAILAITGAGKSNTVSVLLKNIVNLGGTVVVFDFHGEYSKTKLTRNGKSAVKLIQPAINPVFLRPKEFASLIGIKQSAHVQFRYFRTALDILSKQLEEEKGKDWINRVDTETFLSRLKETLEQLLDGESEASKKIKGDIKKESLYEVLNKLEDAQIDLGHVIKLGVPHLIENIEPGKVNVFDFSEFDEEVADTLASNILRVGLEERKKAVRHGDTKLPYPILIVIEEAHILAGEKVNTSSKYWITRIAREGRKFGIGLTIVTQRPKGLDKEILSQMNNMIILKLVEPEDQKHVQRASEALSSELMNYLPSLNPGEGIIIGNMTKIPLLVKIDKAEEKIEGNDIPVVQKWSEILKNEQKKSSASMEERLKNI